MLPIIRTEIKRGQVECNVIFTFFSVKTFFSLDLNNYILVKISTFNILVKVT